MVPVNEVGKDEEAIRAFASRSCQSVRQVVKCLDFHRDHSHINRASYGPLSVEGQSLMQGARIPEDRDSGDYRNGFFEKLQSLTRNVWTGTVGYARHVSAGACEARHEFVLDWVSAASHDNRDRLRRVLGSLNSRCPDRHNHVYPETHQLLRQSRKLVRPGVCKPGLKE